MDWDEELGRATRLRLAVFSGDSSNVLDELETLSCRVRVFRFLAALVRIFIAVSMDVLLSELLFIFQSPNELSHHIPILLRLDQ